MRRLIYGWFTALLLTLSLLPLPLHAMEPVIVLGGGGGAAWFKEPDSSATFAPYTEISGSLGYRGLLGEGYYAASLYGGLRYYGDAINDMEDEQLLSLELGTPVGGLALAAEASFSSSFYNLDRGISLLPDWRMKLTPGEWNRSLTPRVIYFGSYRYEDDRVTDKLVQGVRLGVEAVPSIRLAWYADLLAAYERFPDQDIGPGGDVRQDGRYSLAIGADGIIGFFTGWEIENETGVRLSNAQRPEQDRFFSELDGTLRFSPLQEVGIEMGASAEGEIFMNREARNSDGTTSGETLKDTTLSGLLRLDYTPNGALYFVLEGGAGRSFSRDPAFRGWSSRLSLQVEYSF